MDDEDIARKVAERDQALAGLVDLARTFAGYRKALIDEGVPQMEATMMTIAAQTAIITNQSSGSE